MLSATDGLKASLTGCWGCCCEACCWSRGRFSTFPVLELPRIRGLFLLTFFKLPPPPLWLLILLRSEVGRKLSKLSREAYASVWQVFSVKISNENCNFVSIFVIQKQLPLSKKLVKWKCFIFAGKFYLIFYEPMIEVFNQWCCWYTASAGSSPFWGWSYRGSSSRGHCSCWKNDFLCLNQEVVLYKYHGYQIFVILNS